MAGIAMSSLFSPDPAPPQRALPVDEEAKAFREREQKRAERNRTGATQDQLNQETLIRGRRYGTRSLLGSFGSGGSFLGSG